MTKTRKALLVALPAAALVISGGVEIAAAAGEQPTPSVTEQEQVTSTVRQQHRAPEYGIQVRLRNQDQARLRDGTCDPVGDQRPDRDQVRDRDRMHDPVQDHDRLRDHMADR